MTKETLDNKSIKFHRESHKKHPVWFVFFSCVRYIKQREENCSDRLCFVIDGVEYAPLSCSVWTDKLLATAILVITVGQNEWLNVTIDLFWDASGFVHLRCSEQTLMEVILTNTKLIPDTLAHQHQLFICHCGECCARLLSHAIADRVCLHVSVIAGEQPYHFYVSSGLDIFFTDAQNPAWRNPFYVWIAATSFFFSVFRQSPCRYLQMYCLTKFIPSGLASVGLQYYCAVTSIGLQIMRARKTHCSVLLGNRNLCWLWLMSSWNGTRKQTDLLMRILY